MIKLFVTMDTIKDDDDIIHLLGCIYEKLKISPNIKLINKTMFLADILEDLDFDRMSGHYSDEVVKEVVMYTLNFIEQKERDNEVNIELNDYRLSFNSLNRICIILKFIIGEVK